MVRPPPASLSISITPYPSVQSPLYSPLLYRKCITKHIKPKSVVLHSGGSLIYKNLKFLIELSSHVRLPDVIVVRPDPHDETKSQAP